MNDLGTVKLMKSNEIGLTDNIQLFEDGLRTEKKSILSWNQKTILSQKKNVISVSEIVISKAI